MTAKLRRCPSRSESRGEAESLGKVPRAASPAAKPRPVAFVPRAKRESLGEAESLGKVPRAASPAAEPRPVAFVPRAKRVLSQRSGI